MITLEFWIDDYIHVMRYSNIIPNIGDEVRFDDIAYKLFYKLWIFDDPKDSVRVAFNMEEVKND